MAYTVQNEDFYTVLRVGYTQTTKSATQIANLYSFASVITGSFVGYLVYRIRYLRPFIILGTFLFTVGMVLMALFQTYLNPSYYINTPTVYSVAGAQVVIGIGGGLFPYLTMASIQAAVKRKHLAVITGLYLATYRIGAALRGRISATIVNQVGRPLSYNHLPDFVAGYVYASPFQFADDYSCPGGMFCGGETNEMTKMIAERDYKVVQ
jgi:SIT family siderophore-iron:H+ symporter-like MFS transporter